MGKMFSKHLDIREQARVLQQGKFPVVVGTPNRLLKLCQQGDLLMDSVELVLLDLSKDKKGFHLLELHVIKNDCLKLLVDFVFRTQSPKTNPSEWGSAEMNSDSSSWKCC